MTELIAALDRALHGDQNVLQGFGVEKTVFVRPGWENILSVDGAGETTYFTHGSDRLGDDVGLFRTQLSADEFRAVLVGAKAIAQATLRPGRAEPYDVRVAISLVAAGRHLSFITVAQPESLQRARMKAAQHPVRTLSISLAVPEGVARGAPTVFVLKLHNDGSEGMWVPNPALLPNQKDGDRVAISWAPRLLPTPGIAYTPVVPSRSMLSPPLSAVEQPAYLWLGPKSDAEIPLQATLDIAPDLKELDLAAVLVMYQGEDRVAGLPRFRGSLFSPNAVVHPR